MRQEDLQNVVPGFNDPVMGSQAIFRHALQALSMPGRPVDVPTLAHLPERGHGAAALLLLALLDSDCPMWLSSSLRNTSVQAWLRFHTGCQFVDDPAQARFLWMATGDQWPSLTELAAGTDEYPDQSATCVMEVGSFSQQNHHTGWTISGPGIEESLPLAADGLPQDFDAQWQANHACFPRGIDVFLCTATQVLGLPRSTRLHSTDTVEA